MWDYEDHEPTITITSSDASVSFEINNPMYGDEVETFTLADYFQWAVGA
jgi:hypothetical protein